MFLRNRGKICLPISEEVESARWKGNGLVLKVTHSSINRTRGIYRSGKGLSKGQI